MRLDKYSNPVFNELDIFDALYQGHQFNVSDTMLVERTDEIKQLEDQLGFKFLEPYETYFEVSDYDAACQSNWFMPDEYRDFSPEIFCLDKCTTEEQRQRVREELVAFESRGMVTLLQWLKYFVDTCRSKNIVWGVGRGSSVASYVLFLIGVHKIDSLKYNLDWQEFLR